MRPIASHRDRGVTPASTARPASGTRPTRVIIIDDHEISRAAYRALLRAEGIDSQPTSGPAIRRSRQPRTLRPDVAIIDVTPAADTGFAVADGLRALPAPPIVILTSSTDRTQFGARLNGQRCIANADICAAAIARLARTRCRQTGSPDPGTPAARPQPRE